MALADLPKRACISAKISPIIKPRSNNFVFEVKAVSVKRSVTNGAETWQTSTEIQMIISEFSGVQAPWYTVGWKTSVVIEKTYGRRKLIECSCDQRNLLPTYNKAGAKHIVERKSVGLMIGTSDQEHQA